MCSGNRNHDRRDRRPAAPRRRRGAFSFVEVLFAVMILGVGFIMLAGIFPVAISQTQTTGEENNAANIARSAAAYLESLPGTKQLYVFPADNVVRRFDNTPIQRPPTTPPGPELSLWERVRGNLILEEDPRYAWVPLVRRWQRPPRPTFPITPSLPEVLAHDFAEVTIFVLKVRNRSQYVADSVNGDLFVNNANEGTLIPRNVTVHLREGYDQGDKARIEVGGGNHPVTPGTFIVIAAGNDESGRPAAGRTYRVGNPVAEGDRNEYFLTPGNDMPVLPVDDRYGNGDDIKENTPTSGLPAWVIGEGLDAGGNYFGGAQDVSVYTTYIKLNP